MRRLLHRIEIVHVADSLNIWQDAGADHQSKQVDGYKHSGAGTEGDEKGRGVGVTVVQLHFNHSNLQEVGQERETQYKAVMWPQELKGGNVTIANPDNRADVRLDAFSLARLRYSFLQDSACSECSFRLMLKNTDRAAPSSKKMKNKKKCFWPLKHNKEPATYSRKPLTSPTDGTTEAVWPPTSFVRRVVLCCLHLKLPTSLRAHTPAWNIRC